MSGCLKCAMSHHGATRGRYRAHPGVFSSRVSASSRRTQLADRRLLVRADKGKEIKDAPDKKDEEGGAGGLPAFLKPLTDFGVGRTSVWEGGVGLFILVGAGMYELNAM